MNIKRALLTCFGVEFEVLQHVWSSNKAVLFNCSDKYASKLFSVGQ